MDKPNAVFVDLSNFYGQLLSSNIDDEATLKQYFLDWLDFDLLVSALTDSVSGIWVFYSARRLGPSSHRIEADYLRAYIDRINKLSGVTARDVNIPGEQREPVKAKCPNCKCDVDAEWVSEKGVDASLTVAMFDTIDSWDTAYLLSGDADYVPAVASLRRRGKIVIGAGFPQKASSALIRECYDYVDLAGLFLRKDVAGYGIFRPGGLIESWLSCPTPSESIPLYSGADTHVTCRYSQTEDDTPSHTTWTITFRASPHLAGSERFANLREFGRCHPDLSPIDSAGDFRISLSLNNRTWNSAERRMAELNSRLPDFVDKCPPRHCPQWNANFVRDGDTYIPAPRASEN